MAKETAQQLRTRLREDVKLLHVAKFSRDLLIGAALHAHFDLVAAANIPTGMLEG